MIKRPIFQAAADTWVISEFRLTSMYLLTGTKKALLIDTGFGCANLVRQITELTDLPLIAAATHGHVDHAGGAGFFEEFYISENDLQLVSDTISTKKRQNSIWGGCKRRSLPIPFDVEENVGDWIRTPVWKPLRDGDIIDLGGRAIRVIALPGHTRGSMAFLDTKNRFLFSGDACNPNLLLAKPLGAGEAFDPSSENAVAKYAASVQTYLNSLTVLKSFSDQFDCNYIGHLDDFNQEPQTNDLIDELIRCCRNILSKGTSGGQIPNMLIKETAGRASITYLPGQILS